MAKVEKRVFEVTIGEKVFRRVSDRVLYTHAVFYRVDREGRIRRDAARMPTDGDRLAYSRWEVEAARATGADAERLRAMVEGGFDAYFARTVAAKVAKIKANPDWMYEPLLYRWSKSEAGAHKGAAELLGDDTREVRVFEVGTVLDRWP